ncbi:hypothetical protein O6H91_23G026000 [Diphasiastrum complanatum]|uniref:Uncharacterized protein n=4 Tax=Diphasiastrum complanatum TaxID=34168 RepID=A0ACC2A9F3_DIPCM|nr:hypothetical protein O6H91_23G004700 [Diphasiastrum complanatum]KAJ7513565.1 hypothetical protein O6H91_23G004700 [Diphasiastrum complanatum]KAJ7514076.1 hypothetical protein O6H91_23G026000 [Diphasiastrum complanatum]
MAGIDQFGSAGGRMPSPFAFHPQEAAPGSEDSGDSGPERGRKRERDQQGIMATGGGEGELVVRKPRGRPPGSKNKPKPPIIITRDTGTGMRPHVLEIASGCDINESMETFARRRQRGLCVLGGSGSVANVTLRQPSAPGSTVTFQGRFEILTMSGAFLQQPAPFASAGLTISLAGAQGQVLGGNVVGALMAASPVLVIAASFVGPSYDRLPLDDEEPLQLASASQMSVAASHDPCNMALYSLPQNPMSISQLPADVLSWPTGGGRPHF